MKNQTPASAHIKITNIEVIGFDADDTLWHNLPYFLEVEQKFWALIEEYLPAATQKTESSPRWHLSPLNATEMQNIKRYGYGVKAFILSMIETAIRISSGRIGTNAISEIIDYGKDMLDHPIELMDDVVEVLQTLAPHYRMVLVTKGDLLDQQNKLIRSGLEDYFHHIEIVTEKNIEGYSKLVKHLDLNPAQFVMIGNSLKSDIVPVLKIGGHGLHIPYPTTWIHEQVDEPVIHKHFKELKNIKDCLSLLI
ncbi:MAG: HAD family hydrolase [Pseudomonadales bacterium]|nr:HAD family hydrolase [Pseudomonadales bacterium]